MVGEDKFHHDTTKNIHRARLTNVPPSHNEQKVNMSINGLEKLPTHRKEDHNAAGFSSSGDIEYEYFTWNTVYPTQAVFPNGFDKQKPKFPDLRQYENPFTWSLTRKRWMTWLACSVNAIAAYASGAYASPAAQLEQEWHISYVVYNIGITIFTIGFAVAPMVLAPFSEINGRRPVFLVSGVLFVVCQMWCALANNFASMLAARFFLGVGGSTFSTMVGGILADVWVNKDRNTPMVLFTGATLFGTGLGPLVSGFLAQNLLWRWVFYVQIITSGLMVSLVAIFFKETRGSVLLSRRAGLLNKWYEEVEAAGAIGVITSTSNDIDGPSFAEKSYEDDSALSPASPRCIKLRYKVKSDEERASIFRLITLSCYRPFHMLITEPVIFWFSLWISFAWSVLYLQFGSIPLVFETNHDFSLQQTGLVFIAMCVGAILMTILGIYQEPWADKKWPGKISDSPEGRLYFTCVQSAFLPVGIFWFGWTCYSSIHWIVPTIAIGVITVGIFSIYLAVFNYTADVYRMYASSALAASGLCRNLLGGCFPLVTRQMFNNLGFQAAGSVLGGISLFLTLVPWVLVFYGPSIRKRSRIARHFIEEDAATR